jgi:hypothetical protein
VESVLKGVDSKNTGFQTPTTQKKYLFLCVSSLAY